MCAIATPKRVLFPEDVRRRRASRSSRHEVATRGLGGFSKYRPSIFCLLHSKVQEIRNSGTCECCYREAEKRHRSVRISSYFGCSRLTSSLNRR